MIRIIKRFLFSKNTVAQVAINIAIVGITNSPEIMEINQPPFRESNYK